MSCFTLIATTVCNIGFVLSIGAILCLCTRSNRENYEARSILSSLFYSERIVVSAQQFPDDPEFYKEVLQQHEEVKRKVVEISSKKYGLFCGLRFKPNPVYPLKFPREVDGKLKLMRL